jgi:hypothetical protein
MIDFSYLIREWYGLASTPIFFDVPSGFLGFHQSSSSMACGTPMQVT